MTGWNRMQKNDNATYFVQYQENKNNITIKMIGSYFHCQLKKVWIRKCKNRYVSNYIEINLYM